MLFHMYPPITKNDAKCDIKHDLKDYDAIEEMEDADKKDGIKYNIKCDMKEIDTIDDNVASCIIHVTLNANLNCCVDCNNRE